MKRHLFRLIGFAAALFFIHGCSGAPDDPKDGDRARPDTGQVDREADAGEGRDPVQPDHEPDAVAEPEPVALIDSDLTHWDKLVFGADGEVFVEDEVLHMDMGGPLTGVVYKGEPAELLGESLEDYEITFEAQRLQGMDFFVGLTFPVGTDGHVTLIMGGWGGGLVGLSNLDHADASMNPTTQLMQFESDRWYAVRVVVTSDAIRAWLDGDQVIEVNRADHEVYSLRGEVMDTAPLGLCCFQTHAAYRNMQVRRLSDSP